MTRRGEEEGRRRREGRDEERGGGGEEKERGETKRGEEKERGETKRGEEEERGGGGCQGGRGRNVDERGSLIIAGFGRGGTQQGESDQPH